MHLERIEINGFKSFSDRSELAFDKGVTAIVGPNGCGKSNVADAITWVMGEQSAKSLRGERMEDVICNGSDARKPSAAAEVRLRFSGFLKTISGPAFPEQAADHADGHDHNGNGHDGNGHGNGNGHGHGNGNGNGNGHGHLAHAEDAGAGNGRDLIPVVSGLTRAEAEVIIQSVAREVEVTRRLYRSGESEYLIDGQTCRLRDVHDLLMDTGLGAKAYAIIEQGKIGMILSSRPTDRRQLIEEAAGVTKYKARRRAAELKLEAARQNLLRIDDIVFEVEKQRGTLKRQASKARRYQKLRDELHRWEKVLFARKYRQLAETIESARARLSDARERESAAAARVAEVESDLGRLRIELVESESSATSTRKAAHALELGINRQQQQIAFDREQIQTLEARTTSVAAELEALESRREPARLALAAKEQATLSANAERDRAAAALASESEAYETAHREIEGLEADVEAARSEVFSAINSATALRHALEHAATARDKVAETISKLDVEDNDARIESDRATAERRSAADGLKRTQDAIEATRIARAARESELASARIEHDWRSRAVRAREQELAGLEARLASFEELDAARAGYGDAARAVLVQANGKVNQQGAIADYLEVESGYERAVEACLGDLLQHVVVERPEHAAAGFQLVRDAGAGRCGFLITSSATSHQPPATDLQAATSHQPPDVVALSSVVRVNGPFAGAIAQVLGEAWIARTYESAAGVSGTTPLAVATVDGDLFRGPQLVSGGGRAGARGLLETKREIKDLRDRIAAERETLARLTQETDALDSTIAHASNAVGALHAEHHRLEKAIVGYEAQLQHATDEATRLAQKSEQLARERRQAEEERDTLDRRQEEARASITRLEEAQRLADERLTAAQRRLFEAREGAEDLSRRAADAGAAHAALVERAGALAAEVQRLQEAGADLDQRAAALGRELDETRRQVEELKTAIVSGEAQLDVDVVELDRLRKNVMAAEEIVASLRTRTDELDATIKGARQALDAIRAVVSELDVARATAEADLSHLAYTCEDAVHATLDEVVVEVEQLEKDGQATPDASVICADEPDDASDEDGSVRLQPDLTTPGAAVAAAEQRALSAEEAIATLRGKIDRLGPVNMMAIEQFDELETRHAFLTTQRKDLNESIAQTTEAIARIDETTRQRFNEAFVAINRNFQEVFSTLFGGGRAGLTLLDENDPLESGIEIIAQPPGKRLQSVQLLSGGEKALTAISLMFGMFKFKPSPFCLLDEIDAPLDDANIGRFVEMLRGMQQHTQFIVITHNRKTMEIADRLYGITMEEPGVSKLISVQLN
ncbi:MAG: chromosome segregation protein SMC [Acidobacteria bacterium]|nr:chromosome segregation protein SMC [Acidobacteriota bacterium]